MININRINSREELEEKRIEYANALRAQKKQILICGGTGCVAGGSLKVYEVINEAKRAVPRHSPFLKFERGP